MAVEGFVVAEFGEPSVEIERENDIVKCLDVNKKCKVIVVRNA